MPTFVWFIFVTFASVVAILTNWLFVIFCWIFQNLQYARQSAEVEQTKKTAKPEGKACC